MSRTPFDEFSKSLFEVLLTQAGQVNLNREVSGESRWIDVYFSPNPGYEPDPSLGLLGQLALTPCLFEPFRNPPSPAEIRSCILKNLLVQAELERQTKQDNSDTRPARLWVLTPTLSKRVLNQFGAQPAREWPAGVYSLAEGLQTGMVVLHHLPLEPETLWLRLLGRGKVQKRAVEEVIQLPEGSRKRQDALRLLIGWKIQVEISGTTEEREAMMPLLQAYLEWEQKTKLEGKQEGKQEGRQEGRQEGEVGLILRQLQRKIGQPTSTQVSQIQGMSIDQLETLGEALLDFTTAEDLTQWLNNLA
ncbi:hypothetical protein GlitD10_0648 [Gloeomargarita lithophora Alchichica-D10]|uniref:DUF4351 domain-containing protein n=1 Tax=Gloeomargarita lithophora Alchichica-D10 TaxID=1188229 RepID=A0A1J0AAK6_9CYAN|nr:DUF4351 domain-containing protein [Gloeomargarita lithophora]APB32962.1 hypothetical protein GlitD10_0648 [Gloeomargarita lithophora Alchichica-D10]